MGASLKRCRSTDGSEHRWLDVLHVVSLPLSMSCVDRGLTDDSLECLGGAMMLGGMLGLVCVLRGRDPLQRWVLSFFDAWRIALPRPCVRSLLRCVCFMLVSDTGTTY